MLKDSINSKVGLIPIHFVAAVKATDFIELETAELNMMKNEL